MQADSPPKLHVTFVEQRVQRGTGDAVMVGMTAFSGDDLDDTSTVLIVPGDTPLLRPETLEQLVAFQEGDELLERLRTEEGRVARDDEHGRGVVEVVAAERRHADHDGVTGAALYPLLDEGDVQLGRAVGLHAFGDLLGTVAHHDNDPFDIEVDERWRTWSTIGRPQMTWSGFGRSDRMRVPWPAAKTIAEMLTPPF